MSINLSLLQCSETKRSDTKLWLEQFVDSIKEMNVDRLEKLIDDDIIINDQTKWEFLSEIRDQIRYLGSIGNTYLKLKKEICTLCNRGCEVYFFEGKKTGSGIGIYFKYVQKNLKDVIICNSSTGSFDKQESRNFFYKAYNRYDLIPKSKI